VGLISDVQLKLAAYLIVAASLFGSGFYTAWHYKSLEERAAVADAAVAVVKTTDAQSAVTESVGASTAVAETKVVTVTKTILKKVPVYVTKEADAHCIIPVGFVRLHDAAANGVPSLPDTSGKPDDAASGVELSDIASTVADNYGTYNEVKAQLEGLQSWVKQQQEINNDHPL